MAAERGNREALNPAQMQGVQASDTSSLSTLQNLTPKVPGWGKRLTASDGAALNAYSSAAYTDATAATCIYLSLGSRRTDGPFGSGERAGCGLVRMSLALKVDPRSVQGHRRISMLSNRGLWRLISMLTESIDSCPTRRQVNDWSPRVLFGSRQLGNHNQCSWINLPSKTGFQISVHCECKWAFHLCLSMICH